MHPSILQSPSRVASANVWSHAVTWHSFCSGAAQAENWQFTKQLPTFEAHFAWALLQHSLNTGTALSLLSSGTAAHNTSDWVHKSQDNRQYRANMSPASWTSSIWCHATSNTRRLWFLRDSCNKLTSRFKGALMQARHIKVNRNKIHDLKQITEGRQYNNDQRYTQCSVFVREQIEIQAYHGPQYHTLCQYTWYILIMFYMQHALSTYCG